MAWLDSFHFLRPEWFWLIPLLIVFSLYVSRRNRGSGWEGYISPHLLAALQAPGTAGRRTSRGLTIVFLALWLLALAGPSWRQETVGEGGRPAPLLIALELTPAMSAVSGSDPLELAKFKIRELLAQRRDGENGLAVYAGSAHLVIPPTRDTAALELYLDDLSPDLMPRPGLDLAGVRRLGEEVLAATGGHLLFVGSGEARGQWPPEPDDEGAIRYHYWQMTDGEPLPAAVPVSRGNGDSGSLARQFRAWPPVQDRGQSEWRDEGYWFSFAVALLFSLMVAAGRIAP